jgi:predicted ferric reductase
VSASAEDLLEGPQPSLMQMLGPLAALALVIAVVWSGADAKTVWYVVRGTGVIAYALLALSAIVGLTISGRVAPQGRARVDAYEIHTFTSLLALAFGLTHALSLLLDNFVSFSPLQTLVPFTSDYRPVSVALGIIGIYLTAAIYASFWIRQRIGYKRWRTFHYATFGAFVLITLHAIFSGTDAHRLWLVAIVVIACVSIAGLTVYRAASAQSRPRRVATDA